MQVVHLKAGATEKTFVPSAVRHRRCKWLKRKVLTSPHRIQ